MAGRRFDKRRREPQQRVNHRIRVPEIRVVDANGDVMGVMNTREALRHAQSQGLDLVEINPKANPPVCKILDYGKYKYDEARRKRESKRKQSVVEIKEIKMRPKTDDHDLDFKARAARRFLEAGNKVKFTCRFRGREITHPERARMQLEWIASQCEDICNLEARAQMEGRTMTMMVSPKPAILQALAERRQQMEEERKKAEAAKHASKARSSSPGIKDGESADAAATNEA
ncbi:MAG: translation initiation factor IF-3 [Polyangiaceae bacterium]